MQKGPPLAWKFIQPTVGLFSKVLVKRLFSAVLSKIKDGYPDTHCIRITVLSCHVLIKRMQIHSHYAATVSEKFTVYKNSGDFWTVQKNLSKLLYQFKTSH